MKKKSIIRMGAAAACIVGASLPAQLHAVPAYPGVIRSVQPDGSTLEVMMRGDERGHRIYTPDGYLLMRDAEGYMAYAVADSEGLPVASARRATDAALRGAAERQFLATLQQPAVEKAFERRERMQAVASVNGASPRMLCSGAAFPAKDSPRALVVLVEFQDEQFSMDDPKDFYSRMLNEQGFSDYNATGSARDFFVENSHGVFTPEFDVYGPVMLQYDTRHYGANDYRGQDVAPYEMVIEACSQLDDAVDFSVYDTNADGQIDNVFVFYAGYGEATSKIDTTVWPHSADILDYMLGKDYYYDGKLLNRYGCTCEIDYNNRRPDGIGTFVHEFSHVMGLPDLYPTSYSNAFTPGPYSTLDMGPYNNKGRTPPHYSSFERYCLDWIDPEVLSAGGTYTLEPLHKSNKAYIIPTPREDEFYLLENRQQECCDAFIPGHGMMVWHVDYVPRIWDNNVVNNTPSHQYVDLIEADNRRTDSTRAGDPYPGTNNVTGLNNLSMPALRSWTGDQLAVGIFDISESLGVISFRVETNSSSVEGVGVARGEISFAGRTITNGTASSADVYDLSGRKVAEIAAGCGAELPAGIYMVSAGADRSKVSLH